MLGDVPCVSAALCKALVMCFEVFSDGSSGSTSSTALCSVGGRHVLLVKFMRNSVLTEALVIGWCSIFVSLLSGLIKLVIH